jgi:hypothetical protein
MIQDAKTKATMRLKGRTQPEYIEAAIIEHMSDYFHQVGTDVKEPLTGILRELQETHKDDTDFDFHLMIYQSIIEAISIVLAQNNQDLETLRDQRISKK